MTATFPPTPEALQAWHLPLSPAWYGEEKRTARLRGALLLTPSNGTLLTLHRQGGATHESDALWHGRWELSCPATCHGLAYWIPGEHGPDPKSSSLYERLQAYYLAHDRDFGQAVLLASDTLSEVLEWEAKALELHPELATLAEETSYERLMGETISLLRGSPLVQDFLQAAHTWAQAPATCPCCAGNTAMHHLRSKGWTSSHNETAALIPG